MAFEAVQTGDKYKFEKIGQQLVGYYLGTEEVEIKGKPAFRVTIEQKDGKRVAPLAPTDLKLKLEGVQPNTSVRITFQGKIGKNKDGNPMNVFLVEQDKGDVLNATIARGKTL